MAAASPQQLIPLLVSEDQFVPGEEGWVRTALPAVCRRLRHHRARDAGRVDPHDRRPAEAREGGPGQEDRRQPRSSDQHGRHVRARTGRRAGALSSRSHSDAAEAVGAARLRPVPGDHVEGRAAAARHAAAAAAGDAAGDRAADGPQKSRNDGHGASSGSPPASARRMSCPTIRSIRRRFARRWS